MYNSIHDPKANIHATTTHLKKQTIFSNSEACLLSIPTHDSLTLQVELPSQLLTIKLRACTGTC